jgi:hypothetical protein
MGGKGGDSGPSPMQQTYDTGSPSTTGGWTYLDGTTNKPKTATPKKEEPKQTPIVEDPSKAGAETVAQDPETQPYAPPGWGNYPSSGTNLSGLGDVLVGGMAEPGKAGPKAQNYFGQV